MTSSLRFYLFLTLILVISIPAIAQEDYKNADSVAVENNLIMSKTIADLKLYDYGQTTMSMKLEKFRVGRQEVHYSVVELNTPEGEGFVVLSLNKARAFLSKLQAFLKLDDYKDYRSVRNLKVGNNEVEKGAPLWNENKTYGFLISNGIEHIMFRLKANKSSKRFDESHAVGFVSNFADFTINNFNEYKRRVGRAIKSFLSVMKDIKQSPYLVKKENYTGTSGYKIDYSPLRSKGLKVYKKGIHNTEGLEILADITLRREQRLVPINEYQGEFRNETIVYDQSLNFYVEEDINIKSVMSEIASVVHSYDGTGILDLSLVPKGEYVYAEFTVVK